MLLIYPEPFKLFTESQNAIAESQYQTQSLSDKISVWLTTTGLPFLASSSLTGRREGQVGGYEFFSGEGLASS